MREILFIKTSSLGDVIHHMPALTDARRQFPQARLSWVVEEAFAPLVRLHPAVDAVIPVASRRWRKALLAPATWRDIAASLRHLRAHSYDAVVDTQGLSRSALIARAARGPRHGYDAASIREPVASAFYDVRHVVGRGLHAVVRNRALSGLALGYPVAGAPDYGLERGRFAASGESYAVLLHATARREKEWPEQNWIDLGATLARAGTRVVLPSGNATERARSERIAAHVPGARVPPLQPIDAVAKLIAGASLVVGVDTGLMHLAAAFGIPLVAIFCGSEPGLTGPVGAGPMTVVGSNAGAPTVDAVRAAIEQIAPR
jgi:heptosyltransferase-1